MITQTAPSRRELKKDATRAALKRAALDLALKHGLENLTIEAISEKADVAPRTFFNYFATKEDVLVDRNPQASDELKSAITSRPKTESPFSAVCAVLREFAVNLGPSERENAKRYYQLVRKNPILIEMQTAKLHRFEQTLAEAVAERLGTKVKKDPYPELVAAITVTAVRHSFQRWVVYGGNLEKTVDKTFNQIEKGL